MKTLIIGAGPLGSLYANLMHKAGKDVTLLARGEHYNFLQRKGLILVNEFTHKRSVRKVKVINRIHEEDEFDLVIILIRKNKVLDVLPTLSQYKYLHNFLVMGNNVSGFDEYLKFLPKNKLLFGFPGGGGSRIEHIVHYVDSEKPNGTRMPITIGELDGKTNERTLQIKNLFEMSFIPVKIVDDINSWLKYHVAFVLPLAGALLQSGDNYKLAKDKVTISEYILAVREAGRVLKTLGYKKSYNPKFKLFYLFPISLLCKILSKVFDSKFAEVAMMMHVESAQDEMAELEREFKVLQQESGIPTPHFDKLLSNIKLSISSVPIKLNKRNSIKRRNKMKKVLIAGATGYLGKYLLKELKNKGYKTIALARNSAKLKDFEIDQVIEAEVTKPETLSGICNNVDYVISTVGITRQKDGLTYMDVDYQANINLLEEALKAGVNKFIYVSVLNGQQMRNLKMVEAKERFADAVKSSGLDYSIIRPNGFFSDMHDLLNMAKNGSIYLFGDGKNKGNPIHGADLARFMVEHLESDEKEFDVGGPDLMSQNEIAEVAFQATGKSPKIVHVPVWIRDIVLGLIRIFSGQKVYGPFEFFMTVMTKDMIAPSFGDHHLSDYYLKKVSRS